MCLFKLLDSYDQLSAKTSLEVLSSTEVRCQSPEPSTYLNAVSTHRLQVKVYHIASGKQVYTFSAPFTYYAYSKLVSVFPLFGSENGGNTLLISVENLITDENLYESPLMCRFGFDYSPEDESSYQDYFYTEATILSANQVTCPTADVSSLNLFASSAVDYVDSFVSLSEIDG